MSELLDRSDEDLIEAVGGSHTAEVRAEWDVFDAAAYRASCEAAGVETLCRCDPAYPAKLWDLEGEPAVLHVAGGVERFLELAARGRWRSSARVVPRRTRWRTPGLWPGVSADRSR